MMIVSEISHYMRRTSAADGAARYIPEKKRPHTALGGMRALWYTERRYLGSDSREGLSITSLSILSIIQIWRCEEQLTQSLQIQIVLNVLVDIALHPVG